MHIGSPKGREHRALRAVFCAAIKFQNSQGEVAAGNHPVGTMHIGSPKGREHRALRAVFRALCLRLQNLFHSKVAASH